MPIQYPTGTLAEHRACRTDAAAFDVSHLGTVRVDRAPTRSTGCRRALHQRPGQDRPGAGPVHPPARRGRRLGARRHHRVVGRRRAVRRHAQRLQHRAGARRHRRRRRDRRAGRHRRPGPDGPGPAGRPSAPRPPRSAPVPAWPTVDVLGRAVRGGRHRLHGRGRGRAGGAGRRRRRRCGTRWSPRASPPPGSAPATRCASRRGCRCTATSWARASRRCRPGWAGWWRGARASSGAATPWRPSGSGASPAGCGASWSRAGARRGPTRPVLVDGEAVGEVTSGNFSPTLERGIALAFLPPDVGRGRERRRRRAGHAVPARGGRPSTRRG